MDVKPTILFDGFCNLCVGLIRFLLGTIPNEEFSFVPAQSSTGRKLVETHNLHRSTFETVVLIDGDNIYQQSDAVLHILRRMPYPWKLGALLRVIPRPVRTWFYRIIVVNRYRWFGKRDTCFVGTPRSAKRIRETPEYYTELEK